MIPPRNFCAFPSTWSARASSMTTKPKDCLIRTVRIYYINSNSRLFSDESRFRPTLEEVRGTVVGKISEQEYHEHSRGEYMKNLFCS